MNQLARKLKNLLRPFISFCSHGWQFRNMRYYDCAYFFQGINHLLENYIKEFEAIELGDYVGRERDLKNMKICRALCERIIRNEYPTPFDVKASKQSEDWFNSMVEVEEGGETYYISPKFENTNYVRMKYVHEDYLRKHDKAYLFKTLNKYIDRWWW